MKVLIIDNYDSFTYNLYQYVGELLLGRSGSQFSSVSVVVKRNNELTLNDIKALNPDRIIISPGPGSPDNPDYFGVSASVILELSKTVPILGVCLGMQGMAYCFGGRVITSKVPMHGKTSAIVHDGLGVFDQIPQGISVMRYHSLHVELTSLPACFEVSAIVVNENMPLDHALVQANQTRVGPYEIMGIRHKEYPLEGIQFHPESFATEGSKMMLANFLFQ